MNFVLYNKLRYRFRGGMIAVRDVLLFALDTLFALKPVPGRARHQSQIAIVRLDAIGDLILWSGTAAALRAHYPDKRIVLIGNAVWCELARCLPYFDEVIPVEVKRLRTDFPYRLRLLGSLRTQAYDTLIHPVPSRHRYVVDGESVARVVPARKKIAILDETVPLRRRTLLDRPYTTLIPIPRQARSELERHTAFVRGLGITNFRTQVPHLPLEHFPPSPVTTRPYYVLFPGANSTRRQWPLAHFSRVAERLYRTTGWVGVICGAPNEVALGRRLRSETNAPLEDWVGRTSLPELVATIAQANLLIGNETSGVHIAAAVTTPAVCVLGGGHFGRFVPYQLNKPDASAPEAVYHEMACFGCDWHCIYRVPPGEAAPCVAQITVEAVWQTVEQTLLRHDMVGDVASSALPGAEVG